MIRFLIDWSELWAMLIPLPFMFNRNAKPYFKPVKIYIILALLINLGIMLIWKCKDIWGFEKGDLLYSNNFLYNVHSIVRLLCFSWFFILLRQRFLHRVKFIIPFVFLLLVIINFIFFENFMNQQVFSTKMLAIEAGLLLFYCLQYYIFLSLEERTGKLSKQKGFWIVTGLFVFVGVCFFIFLFYSYLADAYEAFAVDLWDVHNIAYVFLGVCIAVSFKKNI
jgi:hypothetical protein